MFVLLQVAVQVGLLAKAAVAQVTLKGLLLVMDVAHVPLEVGGNTERAITVFTSAERKRGREGERERAK